MSHPTLDTLVLASRGEADVAEHVARCALCATKLRRLEGGEALLREARRSMPDLSWNHLDAVIAREAESAARQMRLSPPRASRPWLRPLTLGLALSAAAAVAVVGLRSDPHTPAPVARTTPPAVPTTTPTPARAPWEGAVLLSTAGATWRVDDAPVGALSAAVALREGGRVETGAEGRAVLAVQPGWKLDLRADSAATLATMRQGEAVVALAQGEALVARAEGAGATASVAVQAHGWTIRPEGAVVTRRGVDVVRVVVLSGRAQVAREGAAPMQFTGPVSLELTSSGEANIQPAEALDPHAMDLGALRAEGSLVTIPATDPAAVISLGEGGATLPRGVSALRLQGSTTLSARVGRSVFTLEIGTGRVLAWTRVNTALAGSAAMNRPRVAPPPTPSLAQPEPEDPGLTPAQIAGVSRAAGMRIRHCFSTCVERNQCGADQGLVRIEIQPDGRAALGAIPASIEGARRCLENEMQAFRGARSNAPYDIAIGFNTRR